MPPQHERLRKTGGTEIRLPEFAPNWWGCGGKEIALFFAAFAARRSSVEPWRSSHLPSRYLTSWAWPNAAMTSPSSLNHGKKLLCFMRRGSQGHLDTDRATGEIGQDRANARTTHRLVRTSKGCSDARSCVNIATNQFFRGKCNGLADALMLLIYADYAVHDQTEHAFPDEAEAGRRTCRRLPAFYVGKLFTWIWRTAFRGC